MEKIIYALNGATGADTAQCAADLKTAGAQSVRINLSDSDVEPAAMLAQKRGDTLPDTIIQCWVPSSNALMRGAIDAVIDDLSHDWSAWLVSESTIIENEKHPTASGSRTVGFSQMAFLTLPDGMSWNDWRAVWRDSHTQIAIDTQSNFEYVQNLVVEPLTDNAAPFVAIVEECFPAEAMTNPLVFFDAADDQAKFDRNLKIMMDSCARFITQGTIDVIPTSQYTFD
jgi:hypothetical protein